MRSGMAFKSRSAITGNSTHDVPTMLTPPFNYTSAASFGSRVIYRNPVRIDDHPAAWSSGCRLAASACDSLDRMRPISSAEIRNDGEFSTNTASRPSHAATTLPAPTQSPGRTTTSPMTEYSPQ
jgi:hypothetical protein